MSKKNETLLVAFFSLLELRGEVFVFPLIAHSVFELVTGDYNKKQLLFLLAVFSPFIYVLVAVVMLLKRKNQIHITWIENIPNTVILYYMMVYYFTHALFKLILLSQQASVMLTGVIVANLSIFLLSYQTKPWLVIGRDERKDRIEKLRRKSKFNLSEWDAIQSSLIDAAIKRKKPSWAWQILEWVIVLGLGVILSVYAGRIVDIIQGVFSP